MLGLGLGLGLRLGLGLGLGFGLGNQYFCPSTSSRKDMCTVIGLGLS